MTDFRQMAPHTVSPQVPANNALERMRLLSVRLLFVVDAGGGMLGAVTYYDIHGERLQRCLRNAGAGRARSGVLVGSVMRTIPEMQVLEFDGVRQARVGDIAAAFQAENVMHLPVVERDPGGDVVIRGLFSATEMMRRLDLAQPPRLTTPLPRGARSPERASATAR
ncbi:MAG: CBS domain-containing protein [Pseudomonadota bacterium]